MRVKHQEIIETVEDTQDGKFLTFAIQDEHYGIEIQYVTEIIGIQKITEMPDLPGFLRGVINLRGKIIPVMDLRLRFKKPMIAYHDRTCIIVVAIQGLSIGLIIDTVSEVLDIDSNHVVPPPLTMMGAQNHYIKAIGKVDNDIKLILDCQSLLKDEELIALTNIQ